MIRPEANARYALYFAPEPGDALHRFGSRWLGRDAETDTACDQPEVPGITPARLAELTRSPRRYGFHATLKAPFRLAAGCDEAGLVDAASALAARMPPFTAPALQLAEIQGWRALVLSAPCPPMQALCDVLVAELDGFRAPPSESEVARRVGNGRLSPQERRLFERWGYPYVFECFRFHMTLTEPVDPDEGRLLDAALADLAAPAIAGPLTVSQVGLFRQPDQESPFVVTARFPLSGQQAARPQPGVVANSP